MAAGSWIMVRKANFGKQAGAAAFMLRAKGKGKMEIRFDDKSAAPVATIEFSSTAMEDHSVNLNAPSFKGVKNIYFVFTEANNVYFDAWQFLDESVNGIEDTSNDSYTVRKTVDLGGRSMTAAGQRGKIVVEQYTDGRGVRHARKRVASTQSR